MLVSRDKNKALVFTSRVVRNERRELNSGLYSITPHPSLYHTLYLVVWQTCKYKTSPGFFLIFYAPWVTDMYNNQPLIKLEVCKQCPFFSKFTEDNACGCKHQNVRNEAQQTTFKERMLLVQLLICHIKKGLLEQNKLTKSWKNYSEQQKLNQLSSSTNDITFSGM